MVLRVVSPLLVYLRVWYPRCWCTSGYERMWSTLRKEALRLWENRGTLRRRILPVLPVSDSFIKNVLPVSSRFRTFKVVFQA